MITRFLFILGLLLPGLASANDWDALNEPGAFAIMRHALAPGTSDPANFDITDCSTQRNLDSRGRAQAARIGQAFREQGHAFDVVLTSQWCRCRDTAELLGLGPVKQVPAFNSFFQDRSKRDPQTRDALKNLRARTDRPFVVTHFVNIVALTGQSAGSGEVLIVRLGAEGLDVLGSVMIDP
jgi:phosphohistidine phosphatase SixA